jgi:hypothetical protein
MMGLLRGKNGITTRQEWETTTNWDDLHDQLVKFRIFHGHCRVPAGSRTGLARFVARLRRDLATMTHPSDAADADDNNNNNTGNEGSFFASSEQEAAAPPPSSSSSSSKLQLLLTPERIQKLKNLDFEWKTNNSNNNGGGGWDENFERLTAFQAQHRHCNVP